MLGAVIFDMDGVLIDSEPEHYKVNKNLFNQLNINVNDEEYKTFIGTSNTHIWTTLKKQFNLSQSVEELVSAQVKAFIEDLICSDLKPISGVVELLKDIKRNNIPIGLASSSPMECINLVLEKFNIKDYFKAVISGEDLEQSKPDPEIFLKTSKLLRVDPENCIVIEDSKNGVAAAKAAGMVCIGYKNVNSGNQDISKADLIVESLKYLNLSELKKCHDNYFKK